MLETIMLPTDDQVIDVAGLRVAVKEEAKKVKAEEDYDKVEAELLKKFGAQKVEPAKEETPEKPAEEKQPAEAKK
jgi:hypothetical protein